MADRKLKDIFVVPPISVLDIKQKYWKDRKKYWLSLSIESELGRGDNLLSLSKLLQKKQKATSVFDPVLCEIMYRWFTEENDVVFDPFAGGSVRGIVASMIKRNYVGTDIRKEQVESNFKQSESICDSHQPKWIHSDALDYDAESFDFLFTCPPYYDLEVYSQNEKDLSNMTENEFEESYEKILTKHLGKLKDNRFCAIVIGDTRDVSGIYRKFLSKTVNIFEKNGCLLYNDLILLQEPATAAMRSFNYMNSSRKIAKCHQNVLVFIKGNVKDTVGRLSKFEDT
jgi:DNA modification methylase